jgi:hypothetical protein
MLRAIALGEKILGPQISRGELTDKVTDITKPLRGSNTKACHTMDQRAQMIRETKWTKFDRAPRT